MWMKSERGIYIFAQRARLATLTCVLLATAAASQQPPSLAEQARQAQRDKQLPPASEAAQAVETEPESQAATQPATPSRSLAEALPQPQQDEPALLPRSGLNVQTSFKVKYVAEHSVYLSSGRAAGLAEGMKLTIKRRAEPSDAANASGTLDVAEIEVVSVASASAVCEVKSATGQIKAGDTAYLSDVDAETLAQTRAISGTRKYPQVVTFSEGDPLEEEVRDEIPRPPLPEINRARGRIGLDYSGISSHGSVSSSSYQLGGVVRADVTRIAGTYWNLSGYWRGRFNGTSSAGQETLQNLVSRTYHLGLTYDNPNSKWVAGLGRMYLPWASSLDTIDGGYVGRRLGHGVTAGIFAGSTPDPTSWDYTPDRHIAGSFINFEGGSYDHVHYTSTSGVALSTIGWVLQRPFVFFENGIFFKRYFSIYQSAQADSPRPVPGVPAAGAGLSRSYVTVRFQPHARISFDLNHNYFRDIPTFSQQLISTGLVDKFLFQGFSAGVRVEPVRHFSLYTDIGRSSRSGDQRNSWNQLYGVAWDRMWKTGLRAEVRFSKFNSSFGSGNYRSLALSRNLGDRLHWQVQAGRQSLVSTFTSQGSSRFLEGSVDGNLGSHYFIQGDFTAQRGGAFDYDQWIMTFGYRFDNRSKKGVAK